MKVSTAVFVTVVVVIALTVEESQAIVCPPNACDTVKCGALSCSSNQKLVQNGGFCGCCDACVNILRHGCFGSYLRRIGKEEYPTFVYCSDEEDTSNIYSSVADGGRPEKTKLELTLEEGDSCLPLLGATTQPICGAGLTCSEGVCVKA